MAASDPSNAKKARATEFFIDVIVRPNRCLYGSSTHVFRIPRLTKPSPPSTIIRLFFPYRQFPSDDLKVHLLAFSTLRADDDQSTVVQLDRGPTRIHQIGGIKLGLND